MIIDLNRLSCDLKEGFDFDYSISLSELEINKEFPFKSPVFVSGSLREHLGILTLDAAISFLYTTHCSRCTVAMEQEISLNLSHILSDNEEDDDGEEVLYMQDSLVDLDNIFTSFIILNLDMVYICKDECMGICPGCGSDLNVDKCTCPIEIDDRLRALQDLLH